MSGRNLFDREREALCELMKVVEARVAGEKLCKETYEAAKLAANKEIARSRKTTTADRESERQTIASSWDAARRSIQEKFESEQAAADQLQDFTVQEANERAKTETENTQSALSDANWTADSIFEASEKLANDQLDTLQRKAAAGAERIEAIWRQMMPHLERGRLSRADFAQVSPMLGVEMEDPLDRMDAAIAQGGEALERLDGLRSLRRVGVGGFLRWFVLFAAIGSIPPLILPEDRLYWILGGVGFASFASLIAHLIACHRARRRCREIGEQLAGALALASLSREDLLHKAGAEHQEALAEAGRHRKGKRLNAQGKYPPMLAKIADRCRSEIGIANEKLERDCERIGHWQHEALQKAEAHFGPMLQQCLARHDAILSYAEELFETRKGQAQAERTRHWREIGANWRAGQERLIDVINVLSSVERKHFLPWNAPFWQTFQPPERVPQGIRFGSLTVDLNDLPGGVPEAEDLSPSMPIRMELPAYLPFPDRCSLILKTRDQGRGAAVQELQTVMMRFLTAIPAGKVRFTIVDPVGLGDNFAAFMHLADYDENLIGARIWTEPAQIEKRLADLTAHMENVIQKYLRNQYKSIEEYNAQAGEVAEPFRVLVVANFPANFSLEACRRLVSIVQSGSTCGVYTLISIDAKQPVPQGFNIADLEQGSVTLVWKNDAFEWKDAELAKFPLVLEEPPSPDEVVRLVRIVGERGRDANRVEVPFDSVIPRKEDFWKSDSRKSIAVPIGRSGATKFQLFQLGKGTAQHALIAGKTGSGKSTLLHAIITNLALHYSPDQVELYLIDFKKGVEFKPYAEFELPHARVVAIESEREFGLSVLQKLDLELRTRGDRFRDAGVNDLNGYREFLEENAKRETPSTDHPKTCPRIVLIVDEFQEFFVEDDRTAQETALLLDRLVRQGRAFGLHILLGSQTLGGAYSLARSTIDQMAVRIALQCSDTDAQLILNKDNTAARLLTRPGEAIYNDANGLMEGNDLFQIVWLADNRRESLLREIHAMAAERGNYPPPLVFEGNIAADIAANQQLAKLLDAPTWPADVKAASAWLGEAIAIKDPTAAVFRPHSGNHLLVIGQNEEAALALFASALASLAAQHDPKTRFLILDGTLEDDANAGFLGQVAGVLPHSVEFAERSRVGEYLAEVGALVTARQKGEQADRTPRYLIIHGLHRFRDLRKSEDDFGFGKRGAERVVSAAEHFTNILREGPPNGVHVLLWCDVLTNLNRAIDRPLLREFGMRVLFQMNANDSSTLIDNPLASRLGRNRALYLTEEAAQPEKFRPYGLPPSEWLKALQERLAKRLEEPPPHAS